MFCQNICTKGTGSFVSDFCALFRYFFFKLRRLSAVHIMAMKNIPAIMYDMVSFSTSAIQRLAPKQIMTNTNESHIINLLRFPIMRTVYLLSFQLKPSLVSFTSKPRAARLSRMRSDVAQSLFALAFMRCSSSISTTFP